MVIKTRHGEVRTPVFMPVGTQGTVKAMLPKDLKELGVEIILGNTYHLYMRPGLDVIKAHGGLHNFAGWDRAILTDSGGFQVYSLSQLRDITDDGVKFKSHIDGSEHFITPEDAVRIQEGFGSDIAMILDVCPPATAPREEILRAMRLTTEWAKRALKARTNSNYALFGIVQGGIDPELRKAHIEEIAAMPFDGYAIGGLSVGEENSIMHEIAEMAAGLLPSDKPRYLMGVGTPEDIRKCVAYGIDMFDCVFPTRAARNGLLFTSEGRMNIKNACYRDDLRPPDQNCSCYTCRNFTRSYLRHLYMAKEILSSMLNTIHNIAYYMKICDELRNR